MNKDQKDPLLDAKLKLDQYINEHLKLPIKRGSYFQCPTGTHEDEDASCRIYPNNPIVCHCFGCKASFDIFQLAHYVEGLPQSGPEFWNITVPHVYKALRMDYIPTELDEETKEIYKLYRAYEDVMNIVCTYSDDPNSLIYSYLNMRGWKLETAQLLNIGTIESYDDYLKRMYEKGWDYQYLEYAGLTSKALFNNNNIIFTVRNDIGKPVGFAIRDTTWTIKDKQNKTGKAKYVNSANSAIYIKGDILYNLHDAKNYAPPLWIVEGYGDVLNMLQNGIHNVATPGSTAFTDGIYSSHIDKLKKHNINEIVLAFDGDKIGIQATNDTLEIFAKYPNFDVSVCSIPENMDPDDYITKYGIERFKELPLLTPFDYKLTKFEHDTDNEKIAREMIKYIGNERSPINQHKMIASLSKRTGVPLTVIQKEVDVINGNKDFQKYEEYKSISENILKEVKRTNNITSLFEVIDSHHKTLVEKIDMNDNSIPDIEHYRNRLLDLRKECSEPQISGFNCGKFKELHANLDGMPKGSSMIGMAGVANIGKCLSENTELVNANTGFICKIKDIREGDNIVSLDDNLKLTKSKIIKKINNGKKETYKLKTLSGKEIQITDNHPFFMLNGWTELKNIKIGDYIATPRINDVFGTVEVNINIAKIIGYLISDGCTRGVTPKYTNINKVILSECVEIAKHFYGFFHNSGKLNTEFTFVGKVKNEVQDIVKKYNLFEKYSYEKTLHSEIFTWKKSLISTLLNRMWSCDGNISHSLNALEVSYCTTSEILAKQIQHLLLRFGIISKIHSRITNYTYKGLIKKGRISYNVSIHDTENIIKFYDEIGCFGKEQKLKEVVTKATKKIKKGSNKDIIPNEIWDIIKQLISKHNLKWKTLSRSVFGVKCFMKSGYLRKSNLNRETCKKIAEYIKDEQLIHISNSDIYWDRVIEIKMIGLSEVYDLEIEHTHNFIANDIIVHNSSFVRALTMELVKNNEDILVIVMSTDDSFKKVIPGYIAIETGLTIGEIRKAGNRLVNDERKRALYLAGWQKIMDLSSRLIVKDISDGGTTIALEKYIKYYKRMFPEKKLFAVVDNFHKLRDDYGNSDSRLKFTHISERIKELTVKYDMPILNVMELRKFSQFNDRPSLQDIKETVDIEYDCDLIWLMHQEMHIKHNTDYFWKLRDTTLTCGWRAMPYVELQFAKNKESGYKDTMHFRFRTDRSEFFESTPMELAQRGPSGNCIFDDSFGKERVLSYTPQTSSSHIIHAPEIIIPKIVTPEIKEKKIIKSW